MHRCVKSSSFNWDKHLTNLIVMRENGMHETVSMFKFDDFIDIHKPFLLNKATLRVRGVSYDSVKQRYISSTRFPKKTLSDIMTYTYVVQMIGCAVKRYIHKIPVGKSLHIVSYIGKHTVYRPSPDTLNYTYQPW